MWGPSTPRNGDRDRTFGAGDQGIIPRDEGGKNGSRHHFAEKFPSADFEKIGVRGHRHLNRDPDDREGP